MHAIAMIHRAIGELKEPEACTEESISKFIRRHYDDLPWAHSTLLRHHLQKLCEWGEIVATCDNCYFLPDVITNLNSVVSTPQREVTRWMQKRCGKNLMGQGKRNRKGQTKKTLQGEQIEMIHGQGKVQQLPEGSLIFGCQQKNPKWQLETMTTAMNLHISSKQVQMDRQHEHRPPGLAADPRLVEENQQPEFFNSESPLDLYAQQKAHKSLPMTPTSSLSLRIMYSGPNGHCELVLPNSERVSEVPVEKESHKLQQELEERRQLRSQSSRQSNAQPKTDTTRLLLPLEGLQLVKSVEKLPEIQQHQGKLCVQKRHAKSRPKLVTQDVPANSKQRFQSPKAVESLRFKLGTVEPAPEEELQRGKLCVMQKASKSELPMMAVSLNLPESDLVSMEQSSKIEWLQRLVRQDGGGEKTRSKSKTTEDEDVSMHFEQLAELSNPEQNHGPETRPVEPCSNKVVQCFKSWKGHKAPQYLLALEAVTAARGLPKDPKKQPDNSVLEQSSPTVRKRRQLWDWSQKTSTSPPPMTSESQLFSSSEVQYLETGLLNRKSPPEPKQTPVESTQTKEQQAMLHGQEKRVKSHTKRITTRDMQIAPQQSNLLSSERERKLQHQTQEKPQQRQVQPRLPKTEQLISTTTGQHQNEVEQEQRKSSEQEELQRQKGISGKNLTLSIQKTSRYSLDSRLASQQEAEQQPVCLNSEREKEKHYNQAHNNSQKWHLRSQQPKSEAGEATTAAESVPVQDQNVQQLQMDCQDGRRPLGQKFGMAQAAVKPSPSYLLDQQEQKPPAPRGRGRPRKSLHNPQPHEQTKRRCQGRHRKPKPDDATMEKQVEEPKHQGLGRPRKLNQ